MGFLDTVFGEPDKEKAKLLPEYPEAKEAREKLLAITKEPLRDIPLRQIAPLQPPSEESELARSTAKELIQPKDIFSLPEVQGIIQEVTAKGDLLANRLGRMLQSSGNITTSTGRDVLGRAVTDVQKSLTASLAPFATSERSRRVNLIPVLERLGLTQEERPRIIEQAEFDALFGQKTQESRQVLDELVPMLQFITGLRPQGAFVTEPGRMGLIEQTSLLAPFVSGLFGPSTPGAGTPA